jgi:DNA-binding NtrC family response regulator
MPNWGIPRSDLARESPYCDAVDLRSRSNPANARLLIVDDDEVISGALFQHLVTRGIQPDLALDGPAAEKLLTDHDYPVILMDAYLTGQVQSTAFELIDRVSELRPDSTILLLTAYGSKQLAEHAAMHPHIALMAKPKPVTYIADLIEDLLGAVSGGGA